MEYKEMIRRGFAVRLVFLMLGVFTAFTILSATYLYFDIQRPLSAHYSAVVSIVAGLRETLTMKTMMINAVSFVLIFGGILILGIIYTHKIAGPMYRVRVTAKEVAQGNLDAAIAFRKKDAVRHFGDSFNSMTRKQGERVGELHSEVRQLKEAVERLRASRDEDGDSGGIMKEILRREERIRSIFFNVQL